MLASAGDDGLIFIWNARVPENKAKCTMTMGDPVVGLAFTPDGAFIAGATVDRILIWKVGEQAIPRASWSRTPHPGWLSPRMNSEPDEEDTHCLGWDASGHKLAYGANSRVRPPLPCPSCRPKADPSIACRDRVWKLTRIPGRRDHILTWRDGASAALGVSEADHAFV